MIAATVAIQASRSENVEDEVAALTLQLEEIRCFANASKGKYPAEQVPDEELARTAYLAEIERKLAFHKDAKIAHSIATAVDSDAQAIAELIGPEEQAHEDRRYALHLSSEDAGLQKAPTGATIVQKDLVQQIITKLSSWDSELSESDGEGKAGPSITYAKRQARALNKLSEEHLCEVCKESFHATSLVLLPCGMRYCKAELKELFVRATTDESLFPPRCCREDIPLELIRQELSDEELRKFSEAETEFNTTDRTYCSNVRCGKFIPSTNISSGKAICGRCGSTTCTMCNSPYHEDEDCPADPALQATLSLAHAQGWQRCYSCRAMVELDHGCNHMTCNCGAQFCYVCSQRWKTCSCAQWNEDRLVRRAREVVQREAPGLLPNAEIRFRVNEMAEELRQNHECRHPGWLTRVEGVGQRFQCEMCACRHRRFILQCPRCHVHICADCRRNRMR